MDVEPVQMCSLCGNVNKRRDYPEVPLCGTCRGRFIASPFWEKMFEEGGKKPATTPRLRAKWRRKFVDFTKAKEGR